MPYTHRPPRPELRDIVERIGIQDAPPSPGLAQCTRILPTGTAELAFHYGDPFVDTTDDGVVVSPRACISGQRSSPAVTRATGRTGIVIVTLAPWGLAALLGVPAHCFRDGMLDLGTVLGDGVTGRLAAQLDEGPDGEARVRAVERFLLAQRRAPVDPIARAAAYALADGPARIAALAGRFGLGPRQLERRFRDGIGLAPKRFARVLRLQLAFGHMRRGLSAADAAADSGYYDQPQFQRDCVELTGLTPASLVEAIERTPMTRAYNDVAMSRFYNTMYVH